MRRPRLCLVIPALNESQAIGKVLDEVPREIVDEVLVVDNGSTDDTASLALSHGAKVLFEPRRGYGNACLAAIRYLEGIEPEVVIFIDGDYSSDPREVDLVLRPILRGEADLVIGNRAPSMMEEGSMPLHARLGNRLALVLLRILYGRSFSDLGPFRAIRWIGLKSLGMKDQTYGWNVEMMIKASKMGLRIVEVDVSYRRRIGRSKISGTPVGSMKAGYRIIMTIIRHFLS
ncbi:glycosyltransferase [Candidatus Bathyarchaeota archaeon]|nr:glycosyltransferase [Candidatus Bathyarchaeota archaeon]